MILYIYVLAAAIAVLGMIGIFRTTLDNMLTEPEKFQALLSNFFVKVSMVEILPIGMVILGYVFSSNEPLSMTDAIIPIVIIAILMIFNIFYIFLQRSPAGNVENELKQRIQSFIFITMALANAIPIVAIVFIFTSINSS
ncbi:hypothetical protein [Oceanobacillus jeddahense]|uniref:hypothetical protein n=1 Tax=Oceanobacillus jeddahense TaxID=1462527 RepID=UPI00059607F4|nr:hypothetical protein [Oceanobacillus jeddahense]